MSNVFVERLWRSVKYEEVYLKAYETISEARVGIGLYLKFYIANDGIKVWTGEHLTRFNRVYMGDLKWPQVA